MPGTVGGQAVADLNVAEAPAIEPARLVFSPHLSHYILRYHSALLISKYLCLGQEETCRVGLSNGGHIAKSKDAGVTCLKGVKVNRDLACFIC